MVSRQPWTVKGPATRLLDAERLADSPGSRLASLDPELHEGDFIRYINKVVRLAELRPGPPPSGSGAMPDAAPIVEAPPEARLGSPETRFKAFSELRSGWILFGTHLAHAGG